MKLALYHFVAFDEVGIEKSSRIEDLNLKTLQVGNQVLVNWPREAHNSNNEFLAAEIKALSSK
jgi:hypothetical protein